VPRRQGNKREHSPGLWELSAYSRSRDRRVYKRFRGTAYQADRALSKLVQQAREGEIGTGRQTLAAYLQETWLPSVTKVSKRGRPLAPTTAARYRKAVEYICSAIGRVRLENLQAAHVERLRDRLIENLAPQTVGDVLRVLSQALRKAQGKGLVRINWADGSVVDRPSADPRPLAVITPELGRRILQAARNEDPWDAAAYLGLGCTLRREEVLALRWADVDFGEGRLTVSRALTYAENPEVEASPDEPSLRWMWEHRLHLGLPKSKAGCRTLDLPGTVAEALLRHKARQSERRQQLGSAWTDLDLVVDRGDGLPWEPSEFSKRWGRFARHHRLRGKTRTGEVATVTFHGLRHGAATLMLTGRLPDRVVIDVMGHADTRILRRYQDVVPELRREAARTMDVLLRGEGEETGPK
jgi:integrase